MITRKNEPKIFLKLISCDFKCKFNDTICNSNQKQNDAKYQASVKSIVCAENTIFEIICFCEYSKYLKRIIDDSVIVCY